MLEDSPDLAKRLVLEVSERARFISGRSYQFRSRLRNLGCRVAIVNFGCRFGLSCSLEMRNPDIVTLDSLIMRRTTKDRLNRLRGFISIASDFAPVVVVDGVDTEWDSQAAKAAGARWIRGDYTDLNGLGN